MPLSMSLLGFGMGTMLANFHMCGIMLVFRAVFNMLVMNASLIGPMCFRCLIFSLPGSCEVLFLLCCTASLFYVLSVCVCKWFGETICNMFGCGCYFVVECYGSV